MCPPHCLSPRHHGRVCPFAQSLARVWPELGQSLTRAWLELDQSLASVCLRFGQCLLVPGPSEPALDLPIVAPSLTFRWCANLRLLGGPPIPGVWARIVWGRHGARARPGGSPAASRSRGVKSTDHRSSSKPKGRQRLDVPGLPPAGRARALGDPAAETCRIVPCPRATPVNECDTHLRLWIDALACRCLPAPTSWSVG